MMMMMRMMMMMMMMMRRRRRRRMTMTMTMTTTMTTTTTTTTMTMMMMVMVMVAVLVLVLMLVLVLVVVMMTMMMVIIVVIPIIVMCILTVRYVCQFHSGYYERVDRSPFWSPVIADLCGNSEEADHLRKQRDQLWAETGAAHGLEVSWRFEHHWASMGHSLTVFNQSSMGFYGYIVDKCWYMMLDWFNLIY